MIHEATFMVTAENGPRPAGDPTECFYCQRPLGVQHAPDCVLRQRTVVVEARIQLVFEVPASWDADMIDFRYNESSWCASNLIRDLRGLHRHAGCLCNAVEVRYVREATEADEAGGLVPGDIRQAVADSEPDDD